MKHNSHLKTGLLLGIVLILSFSIFYTFSNTQILLADDSRNTTGNLQSAQDTIYYSEDFNYGTDDQIPDNWTVLQSGTSKIRIKDPGGHNPFSTKALVAVDTDGATINITGNTTFNYDIENGTFIFDLSAWLAIFGNTHSYYLHLENASYGPVITIEICVESPEYPDWTVKIENQTIGTYSYSEIIHIKIDFAAGFLDASVNGQSQLNDVPYDGGSVSGLRIETTVAGFGDEIWFDNFLLAEYGYTEPSGGIPSWNLFILLTIVFIVTVLFANKRLKSMKFPN
jgi:hypothetical protein